MASLSDSFWLSTRVANSLHLQFLNTPGVLGRVFYLYLDFPRRHGGRLPKQASLTAYSNGGDSHDDYTLPIAACATGKCNEVRE